jgi:putative ABC transport system permease protein
VSPDPTRRDATTPAGFAWAAVRLTARAELRHRWRGLVGLGLLLGLVGGVVLASAAVAVRTATAYPRLVAAVGLDDARVLVPVARPAVAEAFPTLPGVVESWVADTWIAQVDGPAVRYVSVVGGADRPADLIHPVVVAGRPPRDDDPSEVLVSEPTAADLRLAPGDTMTVHLLMPEEIGRFDVGFGVPDGATVRLRVAGIARAPAWGGPLSGVIATPAFARAHPAEVAAFAGFARLADAGPVARRTFADAVAAVHAAGGRPTGPAAYVRPEPSFPTSEVDASVVTARRVLVGGLAIFAAVLGLGGFLVVGQGLVRHHAVSPENQEIERALGMTRRERTAARVAAGSVGAVVAGLVGGLIALSAGLLEPLGSLARFEPAPGFRPPWGIAVLGGCGLAVAFVATTAGAALAAVRRWRRPASSPTGRFGTRIGRRPVLLAGLGLAWRGGGLRLALTVTGVAISIAGVIVAVAFGASLQQLVDTPARYGSAADLSVADARESDVAALTADPRVAALDLVHSVSVAMGADGIPRTVVAVEHRKGNLPIEVVTGSLPTGRSEIALGPRTASRLDAGVGDFVTVAPSGAAPVVLLVTGIVVVQADTQNAFGEVGLVTGLQLQDLAAGGAAVTAEVLAAPGQAGPLLRELSSRLEVYPSGVPDEVRNLTELLFLPRLLAVVLTLVAGIGLVHSLLAAGRRHRHDLAVLSVLGATPGQVRDTLAVAAAGTVLPALVVGVPLGLGLARVLWWETATGVGVGGDLAVPVGLLVAIGPAVLAAALLASAVPAVRAARTPPAAVLAGE